MTDRIPLDHLNSDQYDQLCDELDALRQVARGYCPNCGRGDAAPTVEDWEQQKQRADEAERRLRNIANGHPRADSIQAEIGEMILQTHELRDQLRAADEAARRALEQRQEMAEERYAWQQRGDRAETALAGVRTLRDRWIKAGAPPLGTSMSRWWDKRLVELGAALNSKGN
ncbi:hypothetical protein [Streptomyces scabiei]|uniref:hypothetical protein n=1 Tax=Streptomyces scabiei TaxID=1930 RepID=UPI001B307B85|nr:MULTISPECIES: hypothetical protein [Streptomyces]MBP5870879.1 hypothetical protein [Streptomyces sp. LBUM 1485]MBP5913216.1 hypothetical protein [Streptomyces sp. LBUM 1486]MDX2794622.1 hypothetical protein [Streptomyces scabiei]MDX3822376.1 hypothetical protein [Streptomyces scabiei]QTU57367.1 hypothetical protein F3K21_35080 [Streptomyces sp. LBUM 1480]